MRLTTTSSFTDFVSQTADCAIRRPVHRPSANLPASASIDTVPAEHAATFVHRELVRASCVLIVALLDLTCIVWVFPIANQLAEWAGVSYQHAIYLGFGVMLASIPMVIIATMRLWRRTATTQG